MWITIDLSLLSIFDKIIEKIMNKRLYKFLDENDILYEKQFGFRKNHSMIYSLIEITEKLSSPSIMGNMDVASL